MITWRDILQGPREQSPLVAHARQPLARRAPRDPQESKPQSANLPGALSVGMTIWWHSPLFGEVHGLVALPPTQGMVCVRDHPITGQTVFVPVVWIVRVEHNAPENGRDGFGDIEDGLPI